ncbi:MAG: adenylyltransferase/cytidyltransferase family protein [Verrucomicrobiota bacterium]
MNSEIIVSGAFDNLRPRHLRFLHEASRLGPVTVRLWSDAAIRRVQGAPPKFPEAERLYFLNSVRFVGRVELFEVADPDALPGPVPGAGACWVAEQGQDTAARRDWCAARGVDWRVLPESALAGFPEVPASPGAGRKKVVVTGCYDWLHSGHVRFFEEVAGYGDLYVILGHDANIRLLKGPGHPLQSDQERRYAVASVRHVTQALVSTGDGWLDAAPEIERLKPDIYAVNADGDKGGKREYCAAQGIEYLVLKREPAAGLPARSSTELRGF